jgi:hypothetical protein
MILFLLRKEDGNKMKKRKYWTLFAAVALIIFGSLLFLRGLLNGGEDNWIKDSRGVYVKHGNPSETPVYVLEQKEAINCAYDKFGNFDEEKSSQCLGTCKDYAIDIVHVPRTAEDDLMTNQCEDYKNKIVSHFIELNQQGEIVRIV